LHLQALGAKPHLVNGFFTRDIKARMLQGKGGCDLQQKGRFANAWVPAHKKYRSWYKATPAYTVKFFDTATRAKERGQGGVQGGEG
jgi:hypothetical protein